MHSISHQPHPVGRNENKGMEMLEDGSRRPIFSQGSPLLRLRGISQCPELPRRCHTLLPALEPCTLGCDSLQRQHYSLMTENHRISQTGRTHRDQTPIPGSTQDHSKFKSYVWGHDPNQQLGAMPSTLWWKNLPQCPTWPSTDAAPCHTLRSFRCLQRAEISVASLLL